MTDPNELDNRLTAWWLDTAPSRQDELLMASPPPMPWLAESLARAGLEETDVARFLHDKRAELRATRDAGLNPRPE